MNTTKLIRLAFINFVIVALLGTIMRYKIAYDFPFLQQKNLQLAHQYFAFNGWVSFILMALIAHNLFQFIGKESTKKMENILLLYNVANLGVLFSFALQGYGTYSIIFLTLSVIINFIFNIYYLVLSYKANFVSKKWHWAAIIFNFISAIGAFWLMYIFGAKQINQHTYLKSLYWFLHFQYNGWFFFACLGLFVQYMYKKHQIEKPFRNIFWMFALTCIPAYGLSVLWAKLSIVVFIIVCISAIVQFYAIVYFFYILKKLEFLKKLENKHLKLFFIAVGIATIIKFSLQLGSTIPSVSHFAFGFRPIIIAYLHLVLLGMISIFIVTYLYTNHFLINQQRTITSMYIIFGGIFANELILAAQGVGSLSYTAIPYAAGTLVYVSAAIMIGIIMLVIYGFKKSKREVV
ncbi:MAG: hypothetical protein J5I52_12005 [Saprospiraceae bacterium]|nr:MAG: hypothetical protein UZ09_BCD002001887 [Bacteroidetes bacterium OLB9]MCO6464860.1 hypothetical protein [Saprospiraceae bacterium]MCZ2339917.1 hypothetical protein [Chitinophagales bacterium]